MLDISLTKIKDIIGSNCEKVIISMMLVITSCVIITGEYV
jgi:molecular chaperone HtpG